MINKKEFYQRLKIAGMISFIPLVLVAGPLSGYFLGDYLVVKFKLSHLMILAFVVTGLIAGLIETIRIIRLVVRINQK
ncbi:MAG: hypothetical protein NTW13_04005 [Candidatus Omnitrophica bacterium]|nr:hypothetical protein [Candidatus Omnitrophota bacterium]